MFIFDVNDDYWEPKCNIVKKSPNEQRNYIYI